MNFKKFIEETNNYIELSKIKNKLKENINYLKNKMIYDLNISKKKFFISFDDIIDEKDYQLILSILNINEKIVIISRNKKDFCNLKKYSEVENRIIFYNTSKIKHCLSSDIHIFLYNEQIRKILIYYKKFFNLRHPNTYPNNEYLDSCLLNLWGEDKLKYFFKYKWKKIKKRKDLFKEVYKNVLTANEIDELSNSSGIKYFYTLIKFSINNNNFLQTMRFHYLENIIYYKERKNLRSIKKFYKTITD